MVTLFGRHPVSDYAAWRKVYDEYFPTRHQLGVTGEAVYQSADDPNDITVTFDFTTIEAARAFYNNEQLRAATQKAGVIGDPAVWIATKI